MLRTYLQLSDDFPCLLVVEDYPVFTLHEQTTAGTSEEKAIDACCRGGVVSVCVCVCGEEGGGVSKMGVRVEGE
jgi:hypothetical protein